MAIRAALTGHLVFSTLHTNSAVGAHPAPDRHGDRAVPALGHPGRGARPAAGAQGLRRVPRAPSTWRTTSRGCWSGTGSRSTARASRLGKGCPSCRQTGYSGRGAVFEYLRIDPIIGALINAGADSDTIARTAREAGMRTPARGHAGQGRGGDHLPGRTAAGRGMKEFRYRAMTAGGEIVAGVRRAPDTVVLATEMLAQNLIVLETRPTLGSLGRAFSRAARVEPPRAARLHPAHRHLPRRRHPDHHRPARLRARERPRRSQGRHRRHPRRTWPAARSCRRRSVIIRRCSRDVYLAHGPGGRELRRPRRDVRRAGELPGVERRPARPAASRPWSTPRSS